VNDIITHASALFGLDATVITGPRRTPRAVEARQAVAYVARRDGWSLCEIGSVLHRDHTTIMYSIEAAELRAVGDIDYALRLAALL